MAAPQPAESATVNAPLPIRPKIAETFVAPDAKLREVEIGRCCEILGPRLRECTRLITLVEGKSANDILGSPDEMKFHSCLTLFSNAAPEDPVFRHALEKYFGGEDDPATIARL